MVPVSTGRLPCVVTVATRISGGIDLRGAEEPCLGHSPIKTYWNADLFNNPSLLV